MRQLFSFAVRDKSGAGDDSAALLEAERQFVDATNAKDAERLAACYADDAVLALANASPVTGKPAVLAWIGRLLQNREIAFRYENLKAEVSHKGDLGYTLSRYEVTIVRSDGRRFEEKGRWTQIWRKGQNGWLLVVEMSNVDAPRPRVDNNS